MEGEGERIWKLETSQRESYGGGERNRDVVICRRVSVRGKELSSSLHRPLVSVPLFFSFVFSNSLKPRKSASLRDTTTIDSAFPWEHNPLPPPQGGGGKQSFRSAAPAQENEEK